MPADITLHGDGVTLRPLSEDDVPLLFKWIYTPDVLQWLQLSEDPPNLRTVEGIQERFHRMHAEPFTKVWRIDTGQGTPIGQIELVNIHPLQRRAEIHMLIGEDVRGRGYGTRAIRRLLQHAFHDLNLRRVHLIVDADNHRAIRAYEKSGFLREGLLREHRLRHGQPVDMLTMAILSKDFQANS